MTTPVNFEIAKLLKEKNIKIDTEEFLFYRDEVNNIEEHQIKNRDVLYNYTGFDNYTLDENEYQTYMIADVVMWMYEKRGIWIQTPFSHNDIKPFCWGIIKTLRNISEEDEDINCWLSGIDTENISGWDSPTEAYEAAIEYTLKNLL